MPLSKASGSMLEDTAVVPGSYTNANIVVDQQGRITFAESGADGGGAGSGLAFTTTTNDATAKVIGTISADANTAYLITARIIARRTDVSGGYGAWTLRSVAGKTTGNPTDIGGVYEEVIARTNAGLLVDIVSSAAGIQIFVTGVTGHTYAWKAEVEITNV